MVRPVADCIDDGFVPSITRVFWDTEKLTISKFCKLTKIGIQCNRSFLDYVKDCALNYTVFDHIVLRSGLRLGPVIPQEVHVRSRENLLGISCKH